MLGEVGSSDGDQLEQINARLSGGYLRGQSMGCELKPPKHSNPLERDRLRLDGMEKSIRTSLHLLALFAVAIMSSGCGQPDLPAQVAVPTQSDTPAQVAVPTLADTPTQVVVPTLPLANITCNELSFYLDPSLGSDYECETVPESSDSDIPMDIFTYPTHTELTINDYPLTQTQAITLIYIYPVDRFSELLPDVLPRSVADLKRFISGSTLSSRSLPFLPPMPLIQVFFSQETILAFNGGKGARYITQYNEMDNTINNKAIFYTFQGLTDDGKYWVTVTLPISNPILPANNSFPPPPEGYTEETWSQNYDSYVSQVKNELDAQPPSSFSPTLNILDSLVKSISVK